MAQFIVEVRHAVRTLLRSRGFALVAVATLALGIGANAVLFAVAKSVILEPLPYPNADRLVRLWSNLPENGLTYFSVSALDYADWKASAQSFEAMAAFDRQREGVVRVGATEPQRALVAATTPELFELLDIRPRVGRVFSAAETRSGERVAVVTDEFWRTALGSREGVAGSSIVIDDEVYTILAVMPRSFMVPNNPAGVWIPLDLSQETDRRRHILRVFARLRSDATFDGASAEMARITANLAEQYPDTNRGWTFTMMTLNEHVVGGTFRQVIAVLLGVVVLILLIAATNVTNMMLARLTPRALEAATRLAMGGTRRRVMRSWLIESALLGIVAGIVGLLLGVWAIEGLRALGPASIPRMDEVRLDAAVAAFVLALSVLAGIALGLAPAAIGTRIDVARALREGAHNLIGGRRSLRVRNVLLLSETALTLVLLVGAALLLRSFWEVSKVSPGFEPNGVVTMQVALPESRYGSDEARIRAVFDAMIDRVRAVPGVVDASAVSSAPLGGNNSGNVFAIEGRAADSNAPALDADYRGIMPRYFATMGIGLIVGRDFAAADRGLTDRVIISESMARRYWPGEDVIGKRIRFGDLVNGPWRTIIGVAADVRYQSLETPDIRPMIYLPHGSLPAMTLVARTAADEAALIRAMRDIVHQTDPNLAPGMIATASELLSAALAQRRFQMLLFGVFGALALLLAAVGTYGVAAYIASQRTNEIGLRMALGADARSVLRIIIGQGLTWASAGIGLGLLAALGLRGQVEALLFRIESHDPLAFGVPTLLLLVITLLACWIPARRAVRLDPAIALRGRISSTRR